MNPESVKRQIAALRQHQELVEDEEAWLLSLESETDITELLQKLERKRRESAAYSDANKRIADEYLARSSRQGRQEDALRDTILKLMLEAGYKSKVLPEATLSIANGKPRVLILDEAAVLTAGYFRSTKVVDKEAIKQTLDDGHPVPGATLSNAQPHLTIRVK